MLCGNPLALENGTLVGCGQCRNCRVNKRRAWTARILLEGKSIEATGGTVSWVTLTYAPEAVPIAARGEEGQPVRTLRPRDLQLAFKRLRKLVGPFRFFAVGEYGSKTWRPHYHALVFGPAPLRVHTALKPVWAEHGHTVTLPWGRSTRDPTMAVSDLQRIRSAYVAGYVTKKLNGDDWSTGKLGAREPEFARMSRKPGIGCVPYLAALHETKGAAFLMSQTGDVGATVRIGGHIYPLDRTVRDFVRTQVGVPLEREHRLENVTPLPERTAADYQRAAAVMYSRERQAAYKSEGTL